MPTYRAPGVYIEERSSGNHAIEAVGTNTVGFVGLAPKADARVNEIRWIDNWSQFLRDFAAANDAKSTPLSHAVFGFFLNGGGRCCVVNVGAGGELSGPSRGGRQGIDLLEETDEIAIVCAPGYTDAASYDTILSHCEKRKDCVAVLDGPETVEDIEALIRTATASAPRRSTAGATAPPATTTAELPGSKPRTSGSGFGAFYYPWITVKDPLDPGKLVNVPPSGHVAGVYGRVEAFKAPANEILRGALNVSYRITRTEQETLNPNGVNCIRVFPSDGIRVYGARTLAASSSDFRYVNVRRLMNQIEKSISGGTAWVVFEPNGPALWKSIVRDVKAFLTLKWREGALKGRSPEEAFYVRCDEETNPPEVIDAGQVIIEIGIAPVKPAEFVIFRIGQISSDTDAAPPAPTAA